MNKTILVLVSCAALLGFARPGSANQSGTVKTVRGQVLIERGNSTLQAKVGDPVQERDRVIVQGSSSVGISMRDETLLGVGPKSMLVIDRYTYDPVTREGKVEASILKGTLRFVTGQIGKANPQSVKVMTDSATIGIRGTEFIVEVPGAD